MGNQKETMIVEYSGTDTIPLIIGENGHMWTEIPALVTVKRVAFCMFIEPKS